MNAEDRIRLHHMLDAAQTARRFMVGKGLDDLWDDQLLAFGVVRAIEIIGEAATKISQETRTDYPTIAWKDIIGMRQKIVHDYIDIDYDIVWNTIDLSLPPLIAALEAILGDSEP